MRLKKELRLARQRESRRLGYYSTEGLFSPHLHIMNSLQQAFEDLSASSLMEDVSRPDYDSQVEMVLNMNRLPRGRRYRAETIIAAEGKSSTNRLVTLPSPSTCRRHAKHLFTDFGIIDNIIRLFADMLRDLNLEDCPVALLFDETAVKMMIEFGDDYNDLNGFASLEKLVPQSADAILQLLKQHKPIASSVLVFALLPLLPIPGTLKRVPPIVIGLNPSDGSYTMADIQYWNEYAQHVCRQYGINLRLAIADNLGPQRAYGVTVLTSGATEVKDKCMAYPLSTPLTVCTDTTLFASDFIHIGRNILQQGIFLGSRTFQHGNDVVRFQHLKDLWKVTCTDIEVHLPPALLKQHDPQNQQRAEQMQEEGFHDLLRKCVPGSEAIVFFLREMSNVMCVRRCDMPIREKIWRTHRGMCYFLYQWAANKDIKDGFPATLTSQTLVGITIAVHAFIYHCVWHRANRIDEPLLSWLITSQPLENEFSARTDISKDLSPSLLQWRRHFDKDTRAKFGRAKSGQLSSFSSIPREKLEQHMPPSLQIMRHDMIQAEEQLRSELSGWNNIRQHKNVMEIVSDLFKVNWAADHSDDSKLILDPDELEHDDILQQQFQQRNEANQEEQAKRRTKATWHNFSHCSTISLTDKNNTIVNVTTRSFVERISARLVKQQQSRERQLRFSARTGNKRITISTDHIESDEIDRMGRYDAHEVVYASRVPYIEGCSDSDVQLGRFYLLRLPEPSLPGRSVLAIGKVVEVVQQFGKDRTSIYTIDGTERGNSRAYVALHVFHIPSQLVEDGSFRFAKDTSRWTREDVRFRPLASLHLLFQVHVHHVPQEKALIFIKNSIAVREEAIRMGSDLVSMRVPLTRSEIYHMWIL